jgi:coenzyme F420-reducing hydrogenase beta subunit
MREDAEGFLYPEIDEAECRDCGVCAGHCPVLTGPGTADVPGGQAFYAMRLKDAAVLRGSSSGGVFAGIAREALDRGAIVFGAAYDDRLRVRQREIRREEELGALQGSKYVACDTGDSYLRVRSYVSEGKTVVYSGLPCHIAGLKSFLGKPAPDNLLTIDLICHGTPSHKLFDLYLAWLGKRYGGKIIYYGFRDKDVAGWSCGGKAKTKTKTKTIDAARDPYYASFLRGETYRPSCYQCRYANIQRPGDITIGDCWGIEKIIPEFYSKDGVSLALVNTRKGNEALRGVLENFDFVRLQGDAAEAAQKYNMNLRQPMERPAARDLIYRDIDRLSPENFFRRIKRRNIIVHAVYRCLNSRLVKRPWLVKIVRALRAMTRRRHE